MPHGSEAERFAGVPPHVIDEATGLVLWLTEPLGFVVRVTSVQTHVDLAAARFIVSTVERLVYDERSSEAELVFWVADWTQMTNYDFAARRMLTDWARQRRATIRRLVVAAQPQHSVVRMGLALSQAMLHFVHLRVDIVDDFESALAITGVQPRASL